jgi:thymidylate synthase
MKSYHGLLMDVMVRGEERGDRTGTGTLSIFGAQMRHDMREGFPLLTSKRVPFKAVAAELLWFLRGETNIRSLLQDGCTIWTDWPLAKFRKRTKQPDYPQERFEQNIKNDAYFATTWGGLGPVYGKQWRAWDTTNSFQSQLNGPGKYIWERRDQLAQVIDRIKSNPECRRLLVSAWNPGVVEQQALPPCHFAFQFYCHGDGGLSCHMNMRSTDIFLGLPFNIASYALLTHMVAAVTDRTPRDLIISFGDLHLYQNHTEQALQLLERDPPPLPTLELPKKLDIDDYRLPDLLESLRDYNPLGTIAAPVAV